MKPLQSVQRRKRQPGFAFQLNCHLSVWPPHRASSSSCTKWGYKRHRLTGMAVEVKEEIHTACYSVCLPYDESPRKISGRGPGHLCLWSFRLLGDSKINVFPGIGCHLKFRFNVFWTPFWLVWFKPQFWMIWDGFPSWLKLQRVECIF